MKRLFTLLFALLTAFWVHAQDTSLNLDFSDPAHADRMFFNFDSGGEVLEKSVTNGELKIVLNKKEWHFFQIYVDPLDFVNNPYVSFRIKAEQATPIRMWVKQPDGTDKTIFERTVAAGADYQTFAYTITDLLPLTGNINEIGIDIGGYQLPPATFAGTVYLDEFKLGEVAKPATTLNLDFSEASHADRFGFIFDTGGELTKTLENGELKLVLNKKEWHFFQIWVNPFEFIKNPYVSFRVKALQPTPIRVWVNQYDGTAEKELFNQTIPASEEYQTIQIKVDNVAPLTGYLRELNFDIGGYQVPPATFAGTVYFDEIKMGEAAKPATEVYGTTYAEDFSGALFEGWANGEGYTLAKDGEALKFSVNRSIPVPIGQIGKLPSLSFGGKVLNISESPYINLDIKGTDPFVLSIIPVDNSNNKKEFTVRVVPTGEYQKVSIDLSTIPGLDLTSVERFYFDFNRSGFAFNTTIWVDNLTIGGGAANLALMDAIADKKYYKNTGAKEILLTHIQNASAVTVTSTHSIIQNPVISAVENGMAKLTFTLAEDQTGEETVTLMLQGTSGYENSSYSFKVMVEGNLPPTIDAISDVQTELKKVQKVRLTGVTDGNTTIEQKLSFMVTSTDPEVASGKVKFYRWVPGGALEPTIDLYSTKTGNATVTVTVKDNGDGNNSTSVSFAVAAFENLNDAPTIDPVEDIEIYEDAGPSSVLLTGLGDGDSEDQELEFTIENSNPNVVKNLYIVNNDDNTATLHFEPFADSTGTSTITVMVKDMGGNEANDGNDSTSISFDIVVLKRPVTGYVATLDKSVEGFFANDKYEITEVDSAGFKALAFEVSDKFYWDGVTMNLPEELDLSENPYLTMEVYPIGQNTYHWLWFYDASGERNELNNIAKTQVATAGQWNKLVFDFSGENDWISNATNAPINNKRITRILFDMHNASFVWPPPPNYTGTFIVRNIRIGSAADFERTPQATINPVPDQARFANKNSIKIKLTGISSGDGGTNVDLSLTNSNPAVVKKASVSDVEADGTATFQYSTGTIGKSTITIVASAPNTLPQEISFDIEVLSDSASKASVVMLDINQRFQTMHGFGTFSFNSTYADEYTKEMGGSAVRIGIIGNQFEPVNDNDDPNVLNMEGFNYSAFDWELYKTLKANGVRSFILTSWSPPAWMKTNLSLDHYTAGYTMDTQGTTNRLDFTMYEEFAESMVGVVRAFKQKAGVDLLAIGLQNEPAFHEPYPSAILGPQEFVNLIKVVGKRFKKEGIKTKLYMPEQVSMFVNDIIAYLDAVKADPEADEYTDILAIHGYGSDGITPGQPKFEEWELYRDASAAGNNPKEIWMTETHKDYASWDDALSIAGAIYGALEYGNVSLWTQWAFEGPFVQQGNPTSMLYAMANFAKFIKPGDVRVKTTSSNADVLATTFIDEPSGNTNMVLINKGETPLSVKVESEGTTNFWMMMNTTENRNLERIYALKDGLFILPAKSVTTLVGESTMTENSVAKAASEEARAGEDDDGKKGNGVDIYPNPSNGIFYLGTGSNVQKVEIADLNGRVRYKTSPNNGENSIAVNSLPKGIYVISIYAEGKVRKERIVIE